MELNQTVKNWLTIFGALLLLGVIAAFLLPWSEIQWGQFEYKQAATITVTGQAKGQQANQVARFNAGVTAVNDDRQAAVDQVNQTMESLIQSVRDFGIAEENIQTETISVNQEEQFDETQTRLEPGQWRAANSISVRLEEIERAQELADLLTQSGATNVFGPNFTVDETQSAEADLMNQAIGNAREKAQAAAEASGKTLGEIVAITEGVSDGPVMPFAMEARGAVGDTPIQPGSTTVSQTVTVTFEIH